MRTVLGVLILCLICGVAIAETTGGADWDKDLGRFGNKLRDCTSGHDHDYTDIDTTNTYRPDFETGVGVDLIVYRANVERTGLKKAIPDFVTIENKWDFANENGSVYAVATYDLSGLWKK